METLKLTPAFNEIHQNQVVLDHSLHSARLKEAMPRRKPEAYFAVLAPCQRLCYTKNTLYLRR